MTIINFTSFMFDQKEYQRSYRQKMTTIAVSNENYEMLKNLGKMGDSVNDVISRLLESAK